MPVFQKLPAGFSLSHFHTEQVLRGGDINSFAIRRQCTISGRYAIHVNFSNQFTRFGKDPQSAGASGKDISIVVYFEAITSSESALIAYVVEDSSMCRYTF